MELTPITFIILPLTLLWVGKPLRLLQLSVIASVFEAAAALTLGGFGVQPSLPPAFAFLGYVALQFLLGARYPGRVAAWWICIPFMLVTIYAVASSYILPLYFAGRVWVWPQKITPPYGLRQLFPSTANINQDVYLVVNALLLLASSIYLTSTSIGLRRILNSLFISGFLASGVAFWQFASRVANVPYPNELFYSNPGWAILNVQNIGAIPRINGSFSEPSSLGGFMACCACASGWMMLNGNRGWLVKAVFLSSLGTAVLSTSTTGFVSLVAAAALATTYALVKRSKLILTRIIKAAGPAVAGVVVLGFASLTFAPSLIDDVEQIFIVTATKTDSSSYHDRTNTDIDSLQVVVDTWGLGAGWGSNRSSSLLPGLLSTLGVPGIAGLIWYICRLAGMVGRAKRGCCTPEQAAVIDGCCGGLAGFTISELISGPTITSPIFFILLGLLTATTVRALIEAAQRKPSTRKTILPPLRVSIASAGGLAE